MVGQLNTWATTIEAKIDQLALGLSEANGRALILQQHVETKNAEMSEDLRKVTTAGASALDATIDAFRIELGKHEYAHSMARSQIEAVVVGAERKFKENQDIASNDAKTLYDGFVAECARRDADDAKLRADLQSKFAEVEGMLKRVAASGAAPGATDPLQQDDAWARARATAAAAGPALASTGMPASSGPGAPTPAWAPPGIPTTAHKSFSVINRDWGDNKRLDLVAQPEAFVTWRDRAVGHLAKGRPDIRRLLTWAEKQTTTIDTSAEHAGAVEVGMTENVEEVCYALFEGIKHIIHDNLLGRARICGAGRGLELWRKLHSEWQGAAPQVIAAKAKRFQDPVKCSNVLQLWEALPAWEQLGAEITSGGYPLPGWLMANSLEKLLPDEMLKTVVGRPELADYAPKLSWVRAQMEYVKSNARASHISPAAKGKKDHEDVDMGNLNGEVENDVVIANLQAEVGKRAAAGDWQGMESIANAICALSKGKGKGKGKGNFQGKGGGFSGGGWQQPRPPAAEDGGKGGPKGGKASGGKGGGTFNGTCHFCGKAGHRKSECRAYDAEMAKQRGLNNVDETADGVEEKGGQDAANPPGDEEDVWWMGATYALTPEVPLAPKSARRPESSRKTAFCSSFNRFDALRGDDEEDDDEAYDMLGPTPRESVAQSAVRAHCHSGQCAHGCGISIPKPPPQRQHIKKRKYTRFSDSVALLQPDVAEEENEAGDLALNALGVKTPGAVLIEAVVDSGAADPVAKAGTFMGKIAPSPMSKAGRKYRGPDGTRIPNEGQQEVQFTSDEGHRCGMTWQIAHVERPLIAVSHLSAAGNKVIFSKTGGEIVNGATGKKIKIQRKGGVYVLRMWVPGATTTSKASTFTRPASSS